MGAWKQLNGTMFLIIDVLGTSEYPLMFLLVFLSWFYLQVNNNDIFQVQLTQRSSDDIFASLKLNWAN